MTRQIKTISILLIVLAPLFTVGQTVETQDTLQFEKSFLKLKQQIDTAQSDSINNLQDSLIGMLDDSVIEFFKNPTTFNYSFKIAKEDYSFQNAGQLRLLTVDARNGGSWHMTKTYIQFKGKSGKIGLRTIDGTESIGEYSTVDNLWTTNIYKLKSNLFLIIGNGTGCNSCFYYGARVFQIENDNLIDCSVFGGKSFFTIDTDNYEEVIFKFDKATQTLTYDNIQDNKKNRIKGQFYFNGNKFTKK